MKAAIILFADTDRPEGMGRMANALTSAREFMEADDDVVVIFDGAGVKWAAELADGEHKYHRLFEEVRDVVAGACVYCARVRRQGRGRSGRRAAPRRLPRPPEHPHARRGR